MGKAKDTRLFRAIKEESERGHKSIKANWNRPIKKIACTPFDAKYC